MLPCLWSLAVSDRVWLAVHKAHIEFAHKELPEVMGPPGVGHRARQHIVGVLLPVGSAAALRSRQARGGERVGKNVTWPTDHVRGWTVTIWSC